MRKKRILIVTPKKSLERFTNRIASQTLLWGLDQANIQWEFYNPWNPPPDLREFGAALCWSYGYRRMNFVYHARLFEQLCAREGLPVINSVEGCNINHSFFLTRWRREGIPCAPFTRFRYLHQIELRYPMILRVDEVHKGEQVFLVNNPAEAQEAIDTQSAASLSDMSNADGVRPLDLAIEYVDTKFPDGFFRKWRCYVVGNAVVPRQLSLCPDWLVNLGRCAVVEQALEEDRMFRAEGEKSPELLRRAGVASGSEITALDYTIRSDGQYIFWDANRHFNMTGDDGYTDGKLDIATGRSKEERREDDESLGRAIAALCIERARE